jgi:hypothetical protein
MPVEPIYYRDDWVFKCRGKYGGPGRVVSVYGLNGEFRCDVAFRIAGGFGEFIHVCVAADLRLATANELYASVMTDTIPDIESEMLARISRALLREYVP